MYKLCNLHQAPLFNFATCCVDTNSNWFYSCTITESDAIVNCLFFTRIQQAVYGNGQEGNFGGASMLPGAAGGLFQYSSPLPHPQAPIQPPSTPPIGKYHTYSNETHDPICSSFQILITFMYMYGAIDILYQKSTHFSKLHTKIS